MQCGAVGAPGRQSRCVPVLLEGSGLGGRRTGPGVWG